MSFDEPVKPPPKKDPFGLVDSESEDEDNIFESSNKKPEPITPDKTNGFDEFSSASSEEPDVPKEPPPKTKTALELAVEARRKKVDGITDTPDDDNSTTKPSRETM